MSMWVCGFASRSASFLTPRSFGGRPRRVRSGAVLAFACGAVLSAGTVHGQAIFWTGGGGAPFLWSNPANWSGNQLPTASSDLIFSGTAGNTNVVDGPSFARSISLLSTFPSNVPWNLGGSSLLTLGGAITNNSLVPATVSFPLRLAADSFVTANTANLNLVTSTSGIDLNGRTLQLSASAGRSLTLQHAITGTGGLRLEGAGTISFTGTVTNPYTGPNVLTGALAILARPVGSAFNNNGSALRGPVSVSAGVLRIGSPEQIDNASDLVLTSGAALELIGGETLRSLTLASGTQARLASGATPVKLVLTPGTDGSVALTGSGLATVSALFESTPSGSAPRIFQVPAGGTLSFTNEFTHVGVLAKTGAGSLVLAGGNHNLAGDLDVRAGSVYIEPLNGPFIANGVSLSVGAADGSSPASLQIVSGNPLGTSAVALTVHPNASLTFTQPAPGAFTLRTSSLRLSTNSALNYPADTTFAPTGTVTLTSNVPGDFFAFTPPVTSLANNPVTFDVSYAPGVDPNDFHVAYFSRFTASSTSGGIIKTGPGNLVLNSSPGSTVGFLDVRAGIVSVVDRPLLPNAPVSVGTGATLDYSGNGLSAGPVNLTVAAGGSLLAGGVVTQPVSSLRLAGAITVRGNASLTLAGLVSTTHTPGFPPPSINSPGTSGGGGTSAQPIVLLSPGDNFIAVNRDPGAPSGPGVFDFALNASVGFPVTSNPTTTYRTLTKTGPGHMLWNASDFTLFGFGGLNVQQGAVTLRYTGAGGTTPFNGFSFIRGNGSSLNVENNALGPNTQIYLIGDGATLQMGASNTLGVLSTTGGTTVTSTGSTLGILQAAAIEFNGTSSPLLDTDFGVGSVQPPAFDFYATVNLTADVYARFTRRMTAPGVVSTVLRGDTVANASRYGLLVTDPLPGSAANASGPAFPGPVSVVDRVSLVLDRAASTPANPTLAHGVTVSGTGSVLQFRRPNQLAAGERITVDVRGLVEVAFPVSASPALALRNLPIFLRGTATSTSALRVITPTVTASGRQGAPVVTVFSNFFVQNDSAPLGSRRYYGLIDLGTNDAIAINGALNNLAGTGLNVLRDLARDYLASAATNNGVATRGLGSSSPVPNTRLAILSNIAGSLQTRPDLITYFPRFNTFDGQPVAATDVLLRFTWIGDTDLSGTLDGRDLVNLLEGYSTNATGWENGDFDYDGVVTPADIAAFQTAFAYYTTSGFSLGSPSDFPQGSSGAIPEPTALALLTPCAALIRRRRK